MSLNIWINYNCGVIYKMIQLTDYDVSTDRLSTCICLKLQSNSCSSQFDIRNQRCFVCHSELTNLLEVLFAGSSAQFDSLLEPVERRTVTVVGG